MDNIEKNKVLYELNLSSIYEEMNILEEDKKQDIDNLKNIKNIAAQIKNDSDKVSKRQKEIDKHAEKKRIEKLALRNKRELTKVLRLPGTMVKAAKYGWSK